MNVHTSQSEHDLVDHGSRTLLWSILLHYLSSSLTFYGKLFEWTSRPLIIYSSTTMRCESLTSPSSSSGTSIHLFRSLLSQGGGAGGTGWVDLVVQHKRGNTALWRILRLHANVYDLMAINDNNHNFILHPHISPHIFQLRLSSTEGLLTHKFTDYSNKFYLWFEGFKIHHRIYWLAKFWWI